MQNDRLAPKMVEGLNGKRIRFIACGSFHTIAITGRRSITPATISLCRCLPLAPILTHTARTHRYQIWTTCIHGAVYREQTQMGPCDRSGKQPFSNGSHTALVPIDFIFLFIYIYYMCHYLFIYLFILVLGTYRVTPSIVKGLMGKRISLVSCGHAHSVATTMDGEVHPRDSSAFA